ncbi:MAG: hypothetical protein ACHP84_13315 [Caulobacterales bacterium]
MNKEDGSKVRIRRITIIAACLLGGCANLQGIPSGLSLTEQQSLVTSSINDTNSSKIARALDIAATLSSTYITARNDNLHYAYWSNIVLVPIFAGGVGALYFNASKATLGGLGLAGGSITAFNAFTNARANAKVYQTAINALVCLRVNLSPYVTMTDKDISSESLALEIQTGSNLLTKAAADLKSADGQAEIKADPAIASSLAESVATLTQAVSDGQQVVNSANTQETLYLGLSTYVGDSIRQIDSSVSSKITQTDVTFAAVQGAITQSTGAQKSATPPAVPPVAQTPKQEPRQQHGVPSVSTILKDDVNALTAKIQNIQRLSRQLNASVSAFALDTREQTVNSCIKAI